MAYTLPMPHEVWLILDRPNDPNMDQYLTELIRQAELRLKLTLTSRGLDFDALAKDPDKGTYLHDLVVDAVARIERSDAVKAGLQTETEGNYSYSMSSARDVAAHLWWPDDDLALLGASRARGRVGTIKLQRPRRDW